MITLKEIRSLNPCYDPTRYLPEDWQGTVADLLKVEDCPAKDRIWVVVRLIDPKTARLFAVWCAREALAQVPRPDPRLIAACDVAERFAYGQATEEELEAARVAAWAAWTAAESTAAAAAKSAAWATDVAAYATEVAAAYAAWAVARKKQLVKLLELLNHE